MNVMSIEFFLTEIDEFSQFVENSDLCLSGDGRKVKSVDAIRDFFLQLQVRLWPTLVSIQQTVRIQ